MHSVSSTQNMEILNASEIDYICIFSTGDNTYPTIALIVTGGQDKTILVHSMEEEMQGTVM